MTHNLPIPEDLQHLLEKRLQSDRRSAQRRRKNAGTAADPDQRSGRERRRDKRRAKD